MKKLYIQQKVLISFVIFSVLLTGCQKDEELLENPTSVSTSANRFNPGSYDSEILQSWYKMELKLIQETPGHTPPVAARELGYTGIALYEALLVGGTVNNHSLAGQLNGLQALPLRENGKKYAAPEVANAVMARIVKHLFGNISSSNLFSVDSLEQVGELQYATMFQTDVMNRSRDFGYQVADFIYNWSLTDGGHQAYLNLFPAYAIPVGNGQWMPTPPLYQPPMLPYWGSNRTFVPSNGAGPIDPPASPFFSVTTGSDFYNYALEVYSTVNSLTPAQQQTADFWADGGGTFTPPGHNAAITLAIIKDQHLNLAQATSLMAKVGVAMNDAAIVCWRAKFNSSLMRPITYIRDYIDPNWNSYIPTPPFPAYTSGHASFSGAASKLLTLQFGSNFSFTDSTKIINGFAPRNFSSFDEAALEAANSRLYGGIHYKFDNDNGLVCGQRIAANVAALNW